MMDRRLFLTGMLGLAGATALSSVVMTDSAQAGIPTGKGILDELDAPAEEFEEGNLEAEPMNHRRGHHRRRRRRRRRVWRRYCRREWYHGRWRRRCRRRRVWVWYWSYY
jgi:hypothetical protein